MRDMRIINMDKISKALQKLAPKEKKIAKRILAKLKEKSLAGFDIKKLKGYNDIYRIRKGKIRIIYRIDKGGNNWLITIERRTDNTYNL